MPKDSSPRQERATKQSSPLASRIPPHSYEAEESVLGSLLIDRDAMVKIADFVSADAFYKDKHGIIYQSMVELYEKSEPIDVLSVTNRLKEKRQLDLVGGESAVTHLATVVPTAGNVSHYARIVQKTSTLRRLISAASDISELGFHEQEELDEVLDQAEQSLFAVSQDHQQHSFTKISEALEDAFVRIDKLHKGDHELRGVPTGFHSLNNKLAGWQKSDLIILAARPSVGKTSLALDFARHAALKGVPVGFFSLEMSKEQLVDRLLASQAHVDLWRLRTGKLETGGEFDDFSRIGEAMGELSEAPIYIDDHASNSVMGMRTMARRLQAEHGLGLLIIDYLQLMESNRYKDNRVQEVSDISRGLKRLAIELNVPIIALSQLSRAVEMRTDQRPKLSDLRESGCLAGETRIMRADTGELIPIKTLAQRSNQEPIPVFALDENFKITVRPMTRVFSSGQKRVYELSLRSGRTIRASANHPFQTVSGWSALETLTPGDHIAVPRVLENTQSDNPLLDDELILLAHLIGDGCTVPHQPIHYTSADESNLLTVAGAAERLFSIKPRRVQQKNWFHLYLPSPYRLARGRRNPIVAWLLKLGVGLRHSWEKVVPLSVFQCDQQKIALFLHHLWATDGNISWKILPGRLPAAAIYYASTSKQLAADVQHLLLRLGIVSTVRRTPSQHHRDMYQVHIQGRDMQLLFLTTTGSAGERGLIIPSLIQALEGIKANTNTDSIPRTAWRGIITNEKARVGVSWREVASRINMSYAGSTLFKAGLSRERLSRVAVALESPRLQHLATSGVVWDEIVAITPQGIEEVYDATVPGLHNFVANDIIVHNSIEQDADVVMFIHRPPFEEGEERPEAFDISLLIEKHRNGPTGEIPLRFQSRFVSYTEPSDSYEEFQLVEPQVTIAPK
ncbi:MAG: replicative DNA helicase [Candidatus Andersenbacteria bacterium]